MTPRSIRRPLEIAALGAGLGLGLFALEGSLALRAGAIGLDLDTRGPFALVLDAIRPQLVALLSRVAVAYLVAGVALSAAAAVLAHAVGVRGHLARWSIHLAECLVLAALLATGHAIARPALFDDVAWARGLLTACVDHGQPWHVWAAAAVLLLGHAALALWRGARLSRRTAAALAATAAVVLLARAVPPRSATGSDPLLVLIGVDALRTDRLSAYGGRGDVAPHIDRFVAEATRFDAAYTPLAQTEPAWRSLLTARWPHAAGSRYPLTPERYWPDLPTASKRLADSGFATVFATDCSRFNFQGERSGFATRLQPPRGALNFALEKMRFRALGVFADNALGAAFLPELVDNRALAGIYDPVGYARRLAGTLVRTAQGGPTFFAFHATAVHFPGDPTYPHYRAFVPSSLPLERRLRMVFSPIGHGQHGAVDGWSAEASEALYDELVQQADAQVGTLLQALRDAGLYDRATIVVFSDHGESFHRDQPALSGATPVHGARLSDEENRVVLAIKPSGGRTVASVGALVRLVDLGPTLLDAVGHPPLPHADGESLMPELRGQPRPPRRLFAETGFTHASPDAFDPEHLSLAPRTFDAYAVRSDGVVEMAEAAHLAALREKDYGAYDGRSWWIRSPRRDGSTRELCRGACDDPSLKDWLELKLSEVER